MLASCLLVTTEMAWSQAFPINSDVAIQPAEGQFIYRTQLRYRRFEVDTPDADVDRFVTVGDAIAYVVATRGRRQARPVPPGPPA